MRTFTIARKPFVFEVCIFRDGTVAARRHGPDAMLDHTDTFDGIAEAEDELGVRFPAPPPERAEDEGIAAAVLASIAGDLRPRRRLPVYAGDGHPEVRVGQDEEPLP